MVTLLQLALSNAVIATALALIAAAAAVVFRRPAFTRALWVLVLLKLVTPPLWHINMARPAHTVQVPARVAIEQPRVARDEVALTSESSRSESDAVESIPDHEIAPVDTTPSQPTVRAPRWQELVRYWPAAILGLWALGILINLICVTRCFTGMRRLTRHASPVDSGTLARARELARRVGLRRCPRVLFVDGPMSPMLCAVGVSPRLLLPAELWFRLDSGQRDTVLTHELAHLKRGDHWVRALEVIVAALYWWHPVVWWARRAIREATEQCCDAWVLWALPRSAGSYATALIEAIDFLSTARPAVPALASGMGQFTDLKRRLVMIKRGTAGKALSWPALGAVCTLGGLVLPLAPSFGQVANTTTATTGAPAAAGAESTPATVSAAPAAPEAANSGVATTVESAPATPAAAGSVSVETSTTTDDSTRVSDARREVDRLRAQLARAESRLARLEGRQSNRNFTGIGSSLPGGLAANQAANGLPGRTASAPRTAEEGNALNRIGAAANDNQQQRLDALENQVREILNELRQMKREQRTRGSEDNSYRAR